MITSFSAIFSKIERLAPIPLAVVQPTHPDILAALDSAEAAGWIHPHIFRHHDPAQAAREAVHSVRHGSTTLLMKGDLDTATLLKAVLDKDKGLTTGRRLSHIAVVETATYPKLMFWSDGGVNIQLDESNMDSILTNALQVTTACGISRPNIALLALVEKVTPTLPETEFARQMVDRYSRRSDFQIDGPIALDVAVSDAAARHKGIESPVAGNTDIFIGPSITATNHVVKALLTLGKATGGGIILGAKVPIVLLSRSDTKEIKLNSIALGALLAQGD